MEFSETLKNISLIIASGTVIFGINAWRREFIGRRKIELAEETLVLFFEARDVVSWIRSPMGFAGEGKQERPKKMKPQKERR